MRTAIAALLLVCAGLMLTAGANFADEKKTDKEVVLKGLICCNKCELGKSTKCETLIQVKDEKAKTEVNYFFDKASHGKWHDDICQGAKKGTVTGIVMDDGKKKVITVKKVAYD